MGPFDIILLALLGFAFICTVIELGLSGYESRDYTYTYFRRTYSVDGPAEAKYLVFCSVWTFVVTIGMIVLPLVFGRKSTSDGIFGIVTLVINAVTWVFWLAGFAAWAALFNGGAPIGIAGATLAFAVILWLIFTAFLVLNLLAAFGVLSVERLGYKPMFRGRGAGAAPSAAPMASTGGGGPVV